MDHGRGFWVTDVRPPKSKRQAQSRIVNVSELHNFFLDSAVNSIGCSVRSLTARVCVCGSHECVFKGCWAQLEQTQTLTTHRLRTKIGRSTPSVKMTLTTRECVAHLRFSFHTTSLDIPCQTFWRPSSSPPTNPRQRLHLAALAALDRFSESHERF